MKSTIIKFIATSGMLVTMTATVNAQWTRNAVTQQTYLTNTGDNVGIGTTNPLFKLDIQNAAAASMSFKSTTSNANIIIDRANSASTSGVNYRTAGVPYWQTGTIGTDNYVIRNINLAAPAIACNYLTNNVGIGTTTPANKLTVNGNANFTGNVGIGTAAPAGKLHVESTASLGVDLGGTRIYGNNDNVNNALTVDGNTGGVAGSSYTYTKGYIAGFQPTPVYGANNNYGVWGHYFANGAGGSGGLFSYGASMGASTRYVSLAGDAFAAAFVGGNVGIGTLAPNAPLQFANDILNRKIVLWEGQNDDHQYYGFGINGGTLRYQVDAVGANHCFFAGTSATTSKELMRIQGNGYIGIGTSAPGYLVDIAGDAAGTSYYNCNSTVNYVGNSDIRAYYGTSHPADGYGYGIQTYAGYYGGSFICNDGAYGFGVGAYGQATGTTGTQYGVYGYAGGGTTNYAVYASGLTYSTGGYSSSDAKLKKDVRVIDNAMAKINQLQPRTYTFKTDEYKYMGLPSEQQYGFIAQELEQVFPEMVKEVQQPIDNDYKKNGMLTFKAINYTEMIPVLTQAIQEQQKQIESQKAEIEVLKSAVNSCCDASASSKLGTTEINNNMLFQNQPNPFNQSTVIRYALSSDAISGRIIIRDLNGNLVKQVSIAQSGKGQVTINANELAQGTYTYTLEISGVSVDTKLMVVTK